MHEEGTLFGPAGFYEDIEEEPDVVEALVVTTSLRYMIPSFLLCSFYQYAESWFQGKK